MEKKCSVEYLEQAKAYRDTHKDEAKAYRQKYYADNKAYLLTYLLKPVTCECGFECALANLKRHQKTRIHAKRMVKDIVEKPDLKQLRIKTKIEKLEKQLLELKSIL